MLGRIDGDDFPFVDDHHAVARHAHFRQDVRRKNDRVISRETLDQMAYLDDLLGVETDGRLIENDHVRDRAPELAPGPRAAYIRVRAV